MGEVDGLCHGCGGAKYETQSHYGPYRIWLCPKCLVLRSMFERRVQQLEQLVDGWVSWPVDAHLRDRVRALVEKMDSNR